VTTFIIFLRRRRGSGGIIVLVKFRAKTTSLFGYAAFAVTLLVFESRVVYRNRWHSIYCGGFHRDGNRKSERRLRQSGFTDFVGFKFADYIDDVHGFFFAASMLRVCFFNC
jgi:hypothetical protein